MSRSPLFTEQAVRLAQNGVAIGQSAHRQRVAFTTHAVHEGTYAWKAVVSPALQMTDVGRFVLPQ